MPKRYHRKPSRLPQFLAIIGVVVLVLTIFIIKDKPKAETPTANSNELAEVRLDRALQAEQPTLAFFHSNNCRQCIIMIDTVAQVYPEFSDQVVLVDVNVYDERNAQLLKDVGLQYIPTLIFYDRTGQKKVSVGVIEDTQLRQRLTSLAEGD